MDRRWYFAVGDFLASLLVGIAAGLAAWAIVSPDWNMWAAMALMMPLGMIVGLVLFFPLGALLGAGALGGLLAGLLGVGGGIVIVPVLVLDSPISRTKDDDEDDYSGKRRRIFAMPLMSVS